MRSGIPEWDGGFMESDLFLVELPGGREPFRTASRPRLAAARADLEAAARRDGGRSERVRFMESVDNQRFNAHWTHEPETYNA